MAQRNPSKQQGSGPPRERGQARDTTTRQPQDLDKDDVHLAPESGEKPEASSGDEPARDPDEV